MSIKFYVNPSLDEIKDPHFTLQFRNWDDYTRKTCFYLNYYGIDTYKYIGLVKIGHKEEKETLKLLKSNFLELDEDFFSLGQSNQFYQTLLKTIGKNLFNEYLEAMNDMAFLDAVRDRYEFNSNFRVSLLRTSEAEKAFNEAKKVLYGIKIIRDFNFIYKSTLENAETEHEVNFNFSEDIGLPNRIIALIGKNGTGKTQFLAKFALDLSGESDNILENDTFFPSRPLFSKVIAISYSAFDKFSLPKKNKNFSYKYCGLKDDSGKLLSSKKMIENYKASINLIKHQRRYNTWNLVISSIIGKELAEKFYDEIFEEENYDFLNDQSKLLSSGQSFLMYVITEVLAHIKGNSILLFDEPEMHLHPNAIANFIRMLEMILKKYDSFSILATHSPIILQEIPSLYVNVFDREGNVPMIYKLGIESFGENLDVLTETVFKTIEVEDNYKTVLQNLSKNNSYKEVLNLFNNKLSLNAKTFLLNQYQNPEQELNA